MFSIVDELNKLVPIALGTDQVEGLEGTSAAGQWEEVTKNLSRLGKQQLRTTQATEMLAHHVQEAVSTLTDTGRMLREQIADHQSRIADLRDDAKATRLRVLDCIDMLDDLTTIAKQRDDAQWLSRLERLSSRTLEVLGSIGVTEIPALERPFNEEEHEGLEAVDRGPGQHQFQILEVVRRGFRFNAAVLRRSQVITAR